MTHYPYTRGPYWVPPPPRPPQPPPRRSHAKVVAIVAISLAAIGLPVLAAIGLHSSAVSATASGGSTTSAPTPAGSNQDDWFAAVCESGTFHNGSRLPNADGGATCMSRYGPILFGEYTSSYMARNDAARYHAWNTATIVDDNGATIFFTAPFNNAGNALKPLTQFGFVVTPAP